MTGQTLIVDDGLLISDCPSRPRLVTPGPWKRVPDRDSGSAEGDPT